MIVNIFNDRYSMMDLTLDKGRVTSMLRVVIVTQVNRPNLIAMLDSITFKTWIKLTSHKTKNKFQVECSKCNKKIIQLEASQDDQKKMAELDL